MRPGVPNPSLLGVCDLTSDAITDILRRADELGASPVVTDGRPGFLVGSVFLEPSLRTRVGFAAAAARLGGSTVEVDAVRSSVTSMSESLEDTLRVVAGLVDVLVVRAGRPLRPILDAGLPVPVINAGERGSDAEHPTQALIDLFAVERMRGPIGEQVVGVCGDLGMRSARSFLRLLARRPPRRLVVLTDPAFGAVDLPGPLAHVAENRSLPNVSDLDVMSMVGMAHGSASEEVRTRLRLDTHTLEQLPAHAIVLSPMPVIDEVEPVVRDDPRWRVHEQSDLATPVRMAVLEHLLGPDGHYRRSSPSS